MKLWKYLLIATVFLSALFQLCYGSMLMISPDNINATLDFGDITSNEPLQILIFQYGRLFIPVSFLSVLTGILILKDSSLGIISALVSAALMINAGVGSFIMSDSIAYLFADLGRGLFILVLIILYYFLYYRKNKCSSPS